MDPKTKLRRKIADKTEQELCTQEELIKVFHKGRDRLLTHLFPDEKLRAQAKLSANDEKVQISLPLNDDNISCLFKVAEGYFKKHAQSVLLYYKHDRVAMEMSNIMTINLLKTLLQVIIFVSFFFGPLLIRTEVVSAASILTRTI